MNPLETYLQSLFVIHSSGSAVKETSYYGTLENLLNEVGKTLKPKVRCIINLQNQGAGLPDGGFYTADQFQKRTARNLRMRLAHHLRDQHGESWDRFSVYLTIGDSHLRELESLILCIVKPKGNKQKGKFLKSEDLKRRFGKDVRVRHRREYDEIIGKTRLVARPRSKQTSSNGRLPVLARYIDGRPTRLRARYKGQVLRARVRRDGKIRFDGEIYSSPSVAGASVCKHACNGWKFWQYERAPGDWVLLEKLRK